MDEEKRNFVVFFLVALTIWTAMNAYVFWRLAGFQAVDFVPRAAFFVIAVVLWASYIASRFLENAGIGGLARMLEWVGAHWLGIVFLLFVCLLTADAISGFGRLMPVLAPRLRIVAVWVGVALAILANIQGRRAPVVHSYDVALRGLPPELDGTTIAVVSDTHLGTMIGRKWLDRRVEEVQVLKPDLIVLVGDIIEGDNDNEAKLAAGLRQLSAPMGIWGVTGNHEFYAGLDRSLRLLNEAGVRVLRDEAVELRPGLVLAGVDDLTARRQRGGKSDYYERALANRPKGAVVLLSHSPMYPQRAAELGAGLMLSGHTHAGQIWPFTCLVRLSYTLIHGRYDVNGMTAIVCRGTGTWGPRMRLWGRGEIVKITLHPSRAATG